MDRSIQERWFKRQVAFFTAAFVVGMAAMALSSLWKVKIGSFFFALVACLPVFGLYAVFKGKLLAKEFRHRIPAVVMTLMLVVQLLGALWAFLVSCFFGLTL